MSYRDPGRHVYGLATICFCALTVAWRDFNGWQQIGPLGNVLHREILVYLAAAIWLFGGVAIQWRRTARIGAGALGLLYLTFALMWAPFIVAEPLNYDRWGNFFEQYCQNLAILGAAWIVADYLRRNHQAITEKSPAKSQCAGL